MVKLGKGGKWVTFRRGWKEGRGLEKMEKLRAAGFPFPQGFWELFQGA